MYKGHDLAAEHTKLGHSPANLFKSTKVLMATVPPHHKGCAWYHVPEQVSNPEPLDSRLCILTTILRGATTYAQHLLVTLWV